ncbi:DUF2214 domain-containing protein [Rhodobacter sp. HX-7-19]|uniref:DUF2214 domain-containing protein n=1 Tax=Paragemmobacter kunshanensis TaxID=2583234 RepID=A0A6M1U0K0_9RHOB|nr:DUF6644 family protein [Rhodobacter kunshanensis]NGQ89595.1 DUF2214 domain-containing protein [Rhodobacter kunshanensis]
MLDLLADSALSTLLRRSATAYLLVNASHILGIALLIGAILPLDLRLAGAFPRTALPAIAPLLRGMALAGLTLALLTGAALFATNPAEYATNPAFRIKLALLAAALLNAVLVTRSRAWAQVLSGAQPPPALRLMAAASALLWLSILLAGRWIGFL